MADVPFLLLDYDLYYIVIASKDRGKVNRKGTHGTERAAAPSAVILRSDF